MGAPLTCGFDFCAQFTLGSMNKFLSAAYNGGVIPSRIKKEVTLEGTTHVLELYIETPYFRFGNNADYTNPLIFNINFITRVSSMPEEYKGHFSIAADIYKTHEIVNGKPMDYLVIDFTKTDESSVEFSYFGIEALNSVVRQLLVYLLKNTVKRVPISPGTSNSPDSPVRIGYYNWKIFTDPDFEPPTSQSVSFYEVHDFLALFLNRSSIPMPIPESVPGYLVHNIQHGFYNYTVYNDDYAFAIPADLIYAAVNQQLSQLPLPMEAPGGDGVVINSISFSLGEECFHVQGNASKTALGFIEASADFHAKGGLFINGDTLEVNPFHLDVDLPGWLQLLNFIPLIGQIILSSIERAIEEASANANIEVPIPKFTVFVDGVAISNAESNYKPSIKLNNTGRVHIKPDGIIVGGTFDINVEPVEIYKPVYVVGNRRTKEFHLESCQYTKSILKNRVGFINEIHAWESGYNGCYRCCREYDAMGAADVYFSICGKGYTPDSHIDFNIDLHGELLKITGKLGSKEPFTETLSKKVHVMPDGTYQISIDKEELMAGTWRFKVSCEGWETSFKIKIHGDRRHYIYMDFGQKGYKSRTIGSRI